MRPLAAAILPMLLSWSATVAATPAALPAPSCTPCVPELQWEWDGSALPPGHGMACSVPLVLQLTDDDGDGTIGPDDRPDVVFIANEEGGGFRGQLTAVDGGTGSLHFSVTTHRLEAFVLAGGDLDGDGVAEIVTMDDQWYLQAFRHDGTPSWRGPRLPMPYGGNTILIADLDLDGTPEITDGLSVVDADGALRCSGPPTPQTFWRTLAFGDVHPWPGIEVVSDGRVMSAACDVLWEDPATHASWMAPADFEGDGVPEIVAVRAGPSLFGEMWVRDGFGNILDRQVNPGPMAATTRPLVADLDGDGLAEVFIPWGTASSAYEWTGGRLVEKWSVSHGDPSCCGGTMAFDFDGDGAMEIVTNEHFVNRILDDAPRFWMGRSRSI